MQLPPLQLVPGAKDDLDTTMRSASERTTTMNQQQHDTWKQYMATDIAPGPQLPPRPTPIRIIAEIAFYTLVGVAGMALIILATVMYLS